MTCIRKAKVIRMGDSLGVVLPMDWTRGMNVKAGDTLDICYNGEVIIRKEGIVQRALPPKPSSPPYVPPLGKEGTSGPTPAMREAADTV